LGEEEQRKGKKHKLSDIIQRQGNLMEAHQKKKKKKKQSEWRSLTTKRREGGEASHFGRTN
jgi:hypothetical protein